MMWQFYSHGLTVARLTNPSPPSPLRHGDRDEEHNWAECEALFPAVRALNLNASSIELEKSKLESHSSSTK